MAPGRDTGDVVLFATLTHGTLQFAPASIRASTSDAEVGRTQRCTARLHGDSVVVNGGTLRAVDGPRPFSCRCVCTVGVPVANLTLVLRLHDYTSPVIKFEQQCTRQ